jgi:hypothetical protein
VITVTWAEIGALVAAASVIAGAVTAYLRMAMADSIRDILDDRLRDYMGRELVETRLQHLGTEMESVRKDIDSLTHMVQQLKR